MLVWLENPVLHLFFFQRSDYPEMDPEQDRRIITIRQEEGKIVEGSVPLGYFGDLKEEYEKRNQEYIEEVANREEH